MKLIGLTGGFACGKSTVARMFEDLGIPKVDADELVHELMLPDQEAWHAIVSTFGEDVLENDRQIDRKKLGQIIFHDAAKRKRLEAIIHPKVRQKMHEKIKEFASNGHQTVMLEIPLLFEVGWDKEENLSAIVVVTTDQKRQLSQAKAKFNLDEEGIRGRMEAQLPLSEKIKKADYVIDNSTDLNATKKQVEKIFNQIKKLPAKN